MFRVIIEAQELYDRKNKIFIKQGEDLTIDLEHSLVSLSKWESKFQKSFLSSGEKTSEEIMGYLMAMVVTPNVDLEALYRLSQSNIDEIQQYIESPQSATTFGSMPESRGPSEIVTSELIYYWMIGFNIPWEAQYWHLNRLFALIRICNIKNSPQKKMSRRELAERNSRLNAERRAKLGSSG